MKPPDSYCSHFMVTPRDGPTCQPIWITVAQDYFSDVLVAHACRFDSNVSPSPDLSFVDGLGTIINL